MATFIPNQPISFEPQGAPRCATGLEYVQPVDVTDTTQFQFKVDYCSDADNLLPTGFVGTLLNTDISSHPGNFSFMCFNPTKTQNISYWDSQPFLSDYKYYVLQITVENIIGEFTVKFGGNTVATISTNGTFSFYGFATPSTNRIEIFGLVGASACMSEISMYEINLNYIVGIKDNDGNILIAAYLLDFFENGAFGDLATLVDGFLTISIFWEGEFVCGCYKIFIADPCINTNGQNSVSEFPYLDSDHSDDWDLMSHNGSTLVLTPTGLIYTDFVGPGFPPVIPSATAIDLKNLFVVGKKYLIEYTLQTCNFASVRISIGGAFGAIRTVAGTYSDEIIATGTDLNILFVCNPPFGNSLAEISSFKIRMVDADIEPDYHSNLLRICDLTGSPTLLINACNDTDSFGFNFSGSGFSPKIRVDAAMIQAQYPSERKTEENTSARVRNIFYQRRKKKSLVISPVPEFIHDFLSLLWGYDHFYIDAVEYVVDVDSEYLVEYHDGDDLNGSVKIDVRIKEDLVRNKVCAEEGDGCAIVPAGENYMLYEDGRIMLYEDGIPMLYE